MLLQIQTESEESCTRYSNHPLMPKNVGEKNLLIKSFPTCMRTHAKAYGTLRQVHPTIYIVQHYSIKQASMVFMR